MKKNLLLLIAGGMLALAAITSAFTTAPVTITKPAEGWMKKADGTWAGKMDNKMYWYKLDKDAKLWWSSDGKAWAAVANGMWADKDGKWLKIGEKMLWWSADMGKTWVEVPEWKWQGPNDEWYKFDKDWSLWVNKK